MRHKNEHTNPQEPPFSVNDMVEFLGVNPATFQQWMNRGLVPYEVITRGDRTYRRFGLRDLSRIAIMRTLHRQGFDPKKSGELAKLVEEAEDQVNLSYGGAKLQRMDDPTAKVFVPSIMAISRDGQWGIYGPAATAATMLKELKTDSIIVLDLDEIDRETLRVWGEATKRMNDKERT